VIGTGGGRGTRRSFGSLEAGVERCARLAADEVAVAARDPSVSGWSVAEHLDHLILAEDGILRWIRTAIDDPAAFPGEGAPNRVGRLVLFTGRIPRGRAKAPAPTVPESPDPERLVGRLSELDALLASVAPRLVEVHASRSTFGHPILGHFTPAQWLRFLDVHHRHHEKIIRDIGG